MNQPKKITKSLELTQAEIDKVAKAKEKAEGIKVSEEWYILSEFGYYYGWAGIEAVKNNEISLEEMELLLVGARKVWASKAHDMAYGSFIASVSAQAKKPGQIFNRATQGFKRAMRIDND